MKPPTKRPPSTYNGAWIPDRIFSGIHVLQSTVICFSSASLPAVIHFLRQQGEVRQSVPGQGLSAQLVPLMAYMVVAGMLWMWSAFEAWNGRRIAFVFLGLLSWCQVFLTSWIGPVLMPLLIANLLLANWALFRVFGWLGPRLAR